MTDRTPRATTQHDPTICACCFAEKGKAPILVVIENEYHHGRYDPDNREAVVICSTCIGRAVGVVRQVRGAKRLAHNHSAPFGAMVCSICNPDDG